ncbi:MAG: leucine-rich repeat domain-containing protein [Bacteroidales bacterium]|nr:leucine-rich repeat domain-containing protein [Bacteroidales bacterium]
MKRTLFFICTLLCVNMLCAQDWFWVGDLQYEVTNSTTNQVEVYDADASITTANIPATVTHYNTTYTVTSIGEWAFSDCSSLTSVTIPNSVTYIEFGAFKNCSSLTSVTIGNSVTSIGGSVFEDCNSLTSIDIPNSVTIIGDRAFYCCSSLTSATIGNSVTSIGGYAFYNCSSLTSVTIGNSVTSIGSGAFDYCISLTSITFGNSVTSIGEWAFSNCRSLTSIDIPNSVTSIGDGAFFDCSSLTSITFGESLAEIGENAFATSSLLQNITCLGTNPPILYNNSFPNPNIAIVIVPCGSLEAYSAPTSFWNMLFTDRIEEDCGGETGLEDLNAVEISFFPNPTNSKVTFNQAIERIELIDLMGKTLRTYENESEINIEQLPAGVYYLRLTNNEKQTLRKLIKE